MVGAAQPWIDRGRSERQAQSLEHRLDAGAPASFEVGHRSREDPGLHEGALCLERREHGPSVRSELLERYHDHIERFIERGVRALGPEGAVRLIEEHAGDDLQYIRVNGTVVGGLAGGGLYAIHLLLELL